MVFTVGFANLPGLMLMLCTVVSAVAAPAHDRAARLEHSLVAPCCWSETVADHRSPAAMAMRAEIKKFVGEGKTDREILAFYKAQYGARVLIEPEGTPRIWANVIPWIAIALGLGFVWIVIRRMQRREPAVAEVLPVPAVAVESDDEW
ncbi:MAG TPA: cytochrome c-type biogenesis protein CcmH [Bryobacteraceae bacterium]|nr:cytochrome c-type biogenesis protein CcmH [Bryobacteraceae bacterium]